MFGKPSLQQRLLILLLGSVTTLWLVAGYVIQEEIRHETEEVFDANLVQLSKLLITLVQGEIGERTEHRWQRIGAYPLNEIAQQFHHYEHKIAFQITDMENNLLLKSPHAPDQHLSTRVGEFENRLIDGERWRTFSLLHPQAVIHVGELMEMRSELVHEVSEYLLEYTLTSLPILALLIWWSVRWGLYPITGITQELTERDSRKLGEMEIEDAPRELKPLIHSLNRLFIRLQHSIDKERRFTADAAHELRTPLAAIRIHAEVARNEENLERRTHALRQILSGVDRTTHLVEQLLTLARVDGANPLDTNTSSLNLTQILKENMEILAHQASSAGIQLKLEGDEREEVAKIDGNRELISTLFRNLIDNAIRYTPSGGSVTVTLPSSRQQSQVTIRDTGPGIPEELQQQIFERFYRNNSSVSGSGLGLSITRQIADIHQASIVLKNCSAPDGLEISVTFPSPKV
ncbi:MAG: hypothetical protein HN842_12330 [Gammaproteobacteria bacterium]|jgi:two-component system, OmpR family, sensor histidine kinase QseC|nr:hypothetical protein [Gammaproteobacteria bacterium]